MPLLADQHRCSLIGFLQQTFAQAIEEEDKDVDDSNWGSEKEK